MDMKNKQQQLSPENYIRTRARTLPIGACFINKDWRNTGFAMITVTREHINGNITHGAYMVDLYCLGIKDSFWKFNEHPLDFKEFFDKHIKANEYGFKMQRTSYALAHNIIYGAIEFAEEFGFHPHKSFDLTRHILEPDDERVKLIDIEFGYKGKPLYISGPENPAETTRVLAHLEKMVGKGNYNFVAEAEADDFFNQEDEKEKEKMNYSDPGVKKGLISGLNAMAGGSYKSMLKKPEQIAEIIEKAEIVFLEYMSSIDEMKKATETVEQLFDFNIAEQIFSDEILFGKSSVSENRDFIRKEAERLIILASEGKSAHQPAVEKLILRYPDVPVFKYLLLRFMELKTGILKLKAAFKHYADLFPDYLPFAYLHWNAVILDKDPNTELKFPDNLHLKNHYPQTNAFCLEEVLQYFHLMVMYYGITGETANLLSLVTFMESKHPGLIPETEIFTARLLVLPKVIEWCEEWMKENVK
jgi:hypothetical protein